MEKKKKIAINSGSFSYQKAEVTTYLTAPVTLEVLTTCRTNIHLFPLHSDYSNRGCAGVSFKAYFEKSRKLFYWKANTEKADVMQFYLWSNTIPGVRGYLSELRSLAH